MGKKNVSHAKTFGDFGVNETMRVEMTVSEAAMKIYGVLNKFYAVPKKSLVDVTNHIMADLGFLRGERQRMLRPNG